MIREHSTNLLQLVFWLTLVSPTLIGCTSRTETQKDKADVATAAQSGAAVLPLPVMPPSDYLNTSADAHSIGSRRCAECHTDQATAFHATRHSRSMSLAADVILSTADFTHQKSGYHYTAESADSLMKHTESLLTAGGMLPPIDHPIDYVVGSGRFGHSFLTKADGFSLQSPLTWYSTRQCWDMSPGYDSPDQMSFRRVVSARCLYCHSGGVEVRNQNEFDFVVHETAISCERCHGPGSVHAAQRSSGSATGTKQGEVDFSIVNPRHLNRELSESVCQQCHLQGDTQIAVRGQQFDSFRPGQPLAAFRQDYRMGQSAQMTIVGHVEQMHSSLCYQKTDTLTCITCHKPHHNITDEQLPQHYRQTCLSCHQEDSCGEDVGVRHSVAQDRCVQCHMPAAPTEVPHVAFTHHRIGIHKPAESEPVSEMTTLHAMLTEERGFEPADVARNRGLAWLHIALSKPEADYQQALKSSREYLTQAWDGGARDAEVAAGLAKIAAEISWTEQSELWSSRALALDETPSDARMNALTIQSELHFNRNRNQQALEGFRVLTELRRDARHWFFRGMTEQNLDLSDEAIRSLEKSIELNPRNPGAHAALAAIHQARKDDAKAAYHRDMAAQMAPQ